MNHRDARPAGLAPDAPLPDAAPDEDPLLADPGDGASVVRGGPRWRQLSFRASGLTIELEITGSGDGRRLMGQLIPRQSAVVGIRHGQGVITAEADPLGRFSVDEVPPGQISLRCRLGSDQSPVITGWISLLRPGHGPWPAPLSRLARAVSGQVGCTPRGG